MALKFQTFLKFHTWILFLGIGMILWASYEIKRIDKNNSFKIIRYSCWGLRSATVFCRDATLMSQVRVKSRLDVLDDLIADTFFVEVFFRDNSTIIIYRSHSEEKCKVVREELETAFLLKAPYNMLTFPRKHIFYGGLVIALLGFMFQQGWAKIPLERLIVHDGSR